MKQPAFKTDFSLGEIRRFSQLRAGIEWLHEVGIQRGELPGWPALDEFYSVRPREWTLITGIPGSGKSVWLDNLMLNLAVNSNWSWAIFSAENLPLERHAAQLISLYMGKPFNEGPLPRITKQELEWAQIKLNLNFQFICPPESETTLDRILEIAGKIQGHDPVNGMVIDPWNRMEHQIPAGMSEHQYIGRCLTKISNFARNHEVHVFLVAHPTKLPRQRVENRDGVEVTIYPVPTPYDVSGAAHFYNMADNCIAVWRDKSDERTPAQIHVQKIRFREVGQLGMAELYYDKPTGVFWDPQVGPPKQRRMPNESEMKVAAREYVAAFPGKRREPGSDDE